MPTPLINGQAYSWSQITINILGLPIVGVTKIQYEDDQEMEDNYGAGNFPISRGFGPVTFTGSITLMAEEVEAITAASTTGRLQDIAEFDVSINYLPLNGVIQSHKLKACRFKKNMREISQGDMKIEVEIPLQVGMIDWKA